MLRLSTKILRSLNLCFYKLNYLFYKDVNLNISGGVPLSTEFDFKRTSCVCLENTNGFRQNCSIRVRENAYLKIGLGSTLNNGCIITSRNRIYIGEHVLIGPNVMIFDHDHDIKSENIFENFKSAPVVIEDNVWIGANVIILKGSTIRKNAVIAAGSIVRGEVGMDMLYYDRQEAQVKKIQKE